MTHEQEIEIEMDGNQPDARAGVVKVEARGNTRISGGDESRVRAEGPGDSLLVEEQDDVVLVTCAGDCVVYVPRNARLEIEVQGDLLVEGVAGGVGVVSCKGNATITDVGDVHIHELKGDLRLSQAAALDAQEVRGNAHIGNVTGPTLVNAKGDIHAHAVGGPLSLNAKGNVHLSDATGEEIQINTKGDCHIHGCRGKVSVNAAGNIHLHETTSRRVRAVAKGDVVIHFAEEIGGQAKIVTSGNLHLRGSETEIHKGRGVYSFRFGQGETVLAVVSKGNTIVESIDLDISNLRAVNEEMAEDLAGLGSEIGSEIGAGMGALGAEMGREFGNLGRDIARQVQDRVQRKLRIKMQELSKRAAKGEWGDSKSWSINLGDLFPPPSPPEPPRPPGWDAPFEPVDEMTGSEPVSDEEREMVLRLLEEGKISADEAATLLEALGDAV